jgi:hypothetical protein
VTTGRQVTDFAAWINVCWLPYAKSVEDFERLLPWNVKAALPVTHLHSHRAERQHAVS